MEQGSPVHFSGTRTFCHIWEINSLITFGTLQHQQVPNWSDTTLPFEQCRSWQSPSPDAVHTQLPPCSAKRFRVQHPPAGQLCQEQAWPPGNVICQCTTSILPAPFPQPVHGLRMALLSPSSIHPERTVLAGKGLSSQANQVLNFF